MIDITASVVRNLRREGSQYTYSGSLRASAMGMCDRQHLYSYFGAPREESDGKSLMKMRMGTVLGDDFEDAIIKDFKATEPQDGVISGVITQSELVAKFDLIPVTAHPDVIGYSINTNTKKIRLWCADIKSTGGFPFKKQSTNPDAKHHWHQVCTGLILFKYHFENIIYTIHGAYFPEPKDLNGLNLEGAKIAAHGMGEDSEPIDLDEYTFEFCGEVYYFNTDTAESCVVDVLSRISLDETWAQISKLVWLVKAGDAPADPPQSWACNYCSYNPVCKYDNKSPKEFYVG